MQSNLEQFKTALTILKQYTLDQVRNNLQTMDNHLALAQGDFNNNMKQLRQTLTRYKKVQSQMNYQKVNIQTKTVQSWAPVVTSYQTTSVYKSSLTDSVNKIIQAKKNMNLVDTTLNELEIKVTTQGKSAKTSSNNVDQIQQQIYVLQLALDLNNFLKNNGFNASGIADFEAQKYYDLYMRGVNANG